jgi:hypothetical protein
VISPHAWLVATLAVCAITSTPLGMTVLIVDGDPTPNIRPDRHMWNGPYEHGMRHRRMVYRKTTQGALPGRAAAAPHRHVGEVDRNDNDAWGCESY